MSIFNKLSMIIALLSAATVAAANSDIIRHYGGLAKNYPHKFKIEKIFEQVRNVAPKAGEIRPELKVVNGRPNDPFAVVASSDGTIVLSKLVINSSYRGVSEKQGNARLAFILGHELAHIANGDFLPKAFVGGRVKPETSAKEVELGRQKEINADREGFVYAAMAGYTVDRLLWETDGDFFTTWQKITDEHRQPGSVHPQPEVRAKKLYERLKHLLAHLPYYYWGVRLTHFNRCEKSILLLKHFLTVFPSREVYNNLGICFLEKARSKLGYSIYWLPSLLDMRTRLDDFKLPPVLKGEELSEAVKQLLIKANSAFQSAYDRDPYYAPAKVNLAITAFFLGDLEAAKKMIEQARKLAPDDLDIQRLQTMISSADNSLSLAPKPSPSQAAAKKTWKLPVKLGADTSELGQFEKHGEVRLHDLYEEFFRLPDGSAEVLGLGEEVEMVVLKAPDVTVDELPDYCGKRLGERRVMSGKLLSCQQHWAAWVVDDEVEEVWVEYN